MMTVSFRVATRDDAEQLEQLEARAWTSQTSPDSAHAGPVFGVRLPFEDVIVACAGALIVGYVAIGRRTPFATNAHVGVIRSIVVAPGNKRVGIGRLLLIQAEDEARQRGFRALRLSVMGSNVAARALYESAGFVELGRYPAEFCVGGEWIDDVLLGKSL